MLRWGKHVWLFLLVLLHQQPDQTLGFVAPATVATAVASFRGKNARSTAVTVTLAARYGSALLLAWPFEGFMCNNDAFLAIVSTTMTTTDAGGADITDISPEEIMIPVVLLGGMALAFISIFSAFLEGLAAQRKEARDKSSKGDDSRSVKSYYYGGKTNVYSDNEYSIYDSLGGSFWDDFWYNFFYRGGDNGDSYDSSSYDSSRSSSYGSSSYDSSSYDSSSYDSGSYGSSSYDSGSYDSSSY